MKPAVPATLKLNPSQALKQYTSDPDWTMKTGIGGVLTPACWLLAFMDLRHFYFVPIALAIAALICGYLLRVVRTRVQEPESTKLPGWNDWGDLFMSGITWITIQFGISVIAASFFSVMILFSYYAVTNPGSNMLFIAECTLLSVLLTLFWLHFIATYMWVNLAVEERLAGGLALRKVIRRIRRNPLEFLIAWALSCGLQLAAVIIPTVTIIGILAIPAAVFAAQLLSAQLLAQAWLTVGDSDS